MIGYARSGGTLLARCLASLPAVMLFSEVNPRRWPGAGNGRYTLNAQARAWHGIELRAQGFADGASELAAYAAREGKHLVFRDWSVIDFVPMKENGFKPAGRFSAWDALAVLPQVRAFGFIRDAIDVWISNGCRDDFFRYYRAYLEALIGLGIPIYRYEDFCADPDLFMQRLCAEMGLPYDPGYQAFHRVGAVTGDVDLPTPSRGMRFGRVVNLPRRRISSAQRKWLKQNEDARAVNRLAGYPIDYEARPLENRWVLLAARLRALLRDWRASAGAVS